MTTPTLTQFDSSALLVNQYNEDATQNTGAAPIGCPDTIPGNQLAGVVRALMASVAQLAQWTNDRFEAIGMLATMTSAAAAPPLVFAKLDLNVLAQQSIWAVKSVIAPRYTIAWFWGDPTTLPQGWAVCNGQTVISPADGASVPTPDLRDMFLVGAGNAYSPASRGGNTTINTQSAGAHAHNGTTGGHSVTIAEMPGHTHGYSEPTTFSAVSAGSGVNAITGVSGEQTDTTGGNSQHSHSIDSDPGHVHTITSILPPYAAVYIIMSV